MRVDATIQKSLERSLERVHEMYREKENTYCHDQMLTH